MKKKFLAIIMIIVMCISIGSNNIVFAQTSSDNQENESDISYQVTVINPLYEGIISKKDLKDNKNDYGIALASSETYTTIDDAAKVVRNAMKNHQETVTIEYQAEDSDYETLITDIFNKATEHTGIATEGDYLAYQYAGFSYRVGWSQEGTVYNYTFECAITYYTTLEQEKELDEELTKIMNNLNLDQLSDYEKIKAIYDYICSNVKYDYSHLNDKDYFLQFTAYAALINKTAVCQGYANLFYRMALEAGIDARIIPGTGNGGKHAWNIVKLNDKYYDVDATWDAGRNPYDYFLKCDDNFSDHQRDSEYSDGSFTNQYVMASSDYQVENNTDNDCNHVWQDEYTIDKEATCTESGLITYTCAKCGETKTEEVAQLGHDYETVITFADDGLSATYTSTCKNDSQHTLTGDCDITSEVTTPATCTTKGTTTYTATAIVDGQTVTDTKNIENIDITDHSYTATVVKPTCEAEGYTVYECSVCGDSYKDNYISALGHDYETIITFSDDGESATYTSTCNNDSQHTLNGNCEITSKVTKEATCTAKGTTTYTATAIVDGQTVTDTKNIENIDITDHSYTTTVVEPTCESKGYTLYTCADCGNTYKDDEQQALGHDYQVTASAIEATCTTAGSTEEKICTRCGDIQASTVIPATGHKYKVVEIEFANDGKTATYSVVCENNSEHQLTGDCTVTSKVTKEATCIAKGITTYTATVVIDDKELETNIVNTKEVEDIELSEHQWNGVVTTQPTCTESGIKTYTCTVCKETKTEEVAQLGHDYEKEYTIDKEATCIEEGSKSKHCTRCDEKTDVTVIEKTNHSWDDGTVTTQPTCTESGIKTYTCTVCKETKTEEVAQLGHDYETVITFASDGKTATYAATCKNDSTHKLSGKCTVTSKVTTKATCKSNGITTYTAKAIVNGKTVTNTKNIQNIAYLKTIKLSATAYTYDGKVKKPTVIVTDSKGKKISLSNCSVIYSSGRKNVGVYKVTIKFKGNYKGEKTLTFNINPKGTTISKLTAISKGLTVNVKKQATQTTGYQIQYSTDKSFKKNVKIVTIKKNSTVSTTIKKLSAKKKYYVRVRTYKTVSKKNYYSSWSISKTVKTLK
jgi:hypothetical protein